MKRWLAMTLNNWLTGSVLTTLVLGALTGCQPTFLAKEVYMTAHAGLPRDLEQNSCPLTTPITALSAAPATVNDPNRPPRYMRLEEAIAIALENGHASGRAGGGAGRSDDSFASIGSTGGSLNAQSERVRILSLNPATASAAMEASLARYDPVWITSINWVGTDALSGVPNLPGYLGTVPGQTATFQSSVVKAFPTGGVAEVSFLTDYRLLNNQANNPFAFGPLNPQYSARLSVGFEQPLWRDWGVDINQLLSRFPNILGQGLVGNNSLIGFNNHENAVSSFVDRQSEGILISRLRFDQQRAEFERNIHVLLVNAEVAYWTLYNKYGQLYAFEENLRIMHKAWQDNYNRFKIGALAPEKYYQVLGQYEEFRGERLRALNEVIDAERNLRGILGMPVEDGSRLVPITPPTLAELKPDWNDSLRDALNLRPELQLARDNLRYHQYLLTIQKNNMKPDLRAYFRLEPFGNGSSLTGSGTFIDSSNTVQTTNAFRSLANGHLADYQLGLNLNIPLGYRAEMAAVRAARLELTQSYLLLKDQEEKAERFLATQAAEVAHYYKRIQAHRAERMGYRDSLLTRYTLYLNGKLIIGDPEFLEAQRRYAAALVKEYDAIAQYNSYLARLEWAKGTIMRYNNVHISEGSLPQMVQVRAVEYQKEQSRAMVLRDRPDSLYQPGRLCGTKETEPASLEAPPDLEQLPAPKQIEPAKHEEPGKFRPQPVTPRPLDERRSPSDRDAKPIEFQRESKPGPLPILETKPLPVAPPTTRVLPKAPGENGLDAGPILLPSTPRDSSFVPASGPEAKQTGTGGVTTPDNAAAIAVRSSVVWRGAFPTPATAQVDNRTVSRDPQAIDFTSALPR